jgi:hypothetical protein
MLMIRDLRMVIAPNLDISHGYLHRGPGSEKIVLQQRFVSRMRTECTVDRFSFAGWKTKKLTVHLHTKFGWQAPCTFC